MCISTLWPKPNDRQFLDIFKCIFWMKFEISMRFVFKCWTNSKPALVQIKIWHRTVYWRSQSASKSSRKLCIVYQSKNYITFTNTHSFIFFPIHHGHWKITLCVDSVSDVSVPSETRYGILSWHISRSLNKNQIVKRRTKMTPDFTRFILMKGN